VAHTVLLGCPHDGTISWGAGQSVWRGSRNHNLLVQGMAAPSLLAMGFNSLWADALTRNENGEITHFAMLHSDIGAGEFWIDTLMRIMEERKCDFVSVINAIKDNRGVTSSGLAIPGISWKPWRRFTMKQLYLMPPTFDVTEIGYPDFVLLHNTGCWLADLRNPLFHERDEEDNLKLFFRISDRIHKSNGCYKVNVEPEDWFFSRRLHELGAKTCMTREVKTTHLGRSEWENQEDWGTYTEDIDLIRDWNDDIHGEIRSLVHVAE